MGDEFIDGIVEPTEEKDWRYVSLEPDKAAQEILKNLVSNTNVPDYIQHAVDIVMKYLNNYSPSEREARLNAIKKQIDETPKEGLPREVKIAFELIN